jgi:hypothetical protein
MKKFLEKTSSEVGEFDYLIYRSFLRLNGSTHKELQEISRPNRTCIKMDGGRIEGFIQKEIRLNNRNFDEYKI